MIIKQYIRDFERLGFGLFVHYGLYSVLGKGEWAEELLSIPRERYERELAAQFSPRPDWAQQLAQAAKNTGCRYITLTVRHHDGFSLYDAGDLTDFDAPHVCGRDLAQEFVDACRGNGLVPFFYHTLLDWHEPTYRTDFPAYLRYLRKSVERLCTRYGKIGGIWFDGMWERPNDDWEEDALYGMIRSHQPEAMIINNTGMQAMGVLGHIELDSVTFERGKPLPINQADAPKYIASEMCQVLADHWGYAADDLNYKAPADAIRDLAVCRRYGSNLLLNVGPVGDGSLRAMDAAVLELLGRWTALNREAIYVPRPTGIAVEGQQDDFLLREGDTYYLFCDHLPMVADPNVAKYAETEYAVSFPLECTITAAEWVDTGEPVAFTQQEGKTTVTTVPFTYGRNTVVRVVRLHTQSAENDERKGV